MKLRYWLGLRKFYNGQRVIAIASLNPETQHLVNVATGTICGYVGEFRGQGICWHVHWDEHLPRPKNFPFQVGIEPESCLAPLTKPPSALRQEDAATEQFLERLRKLAREPGVHVLGPAETVPPKGEMMDDRIRLDAKFFSEILMLPDGTTREIVSLERVERWLRNKDHAIALLEEEVDSLTGNCGHHRYMT